MPFGELVILGIPRQHFKALFKIDRIENKVIYGKAIAGEWYADKAGLGNVSWPNGNLKMFSILQTLENAYAQAVQKENDRLFNEFRDIAKKIIMEMQCEAPEEEGQGVEREDQRVE
ncbi:hypothetical protein KGP36_06890 [Patescibacteria group bacterium]|nr:hypothetical protein [Patescibacteria group bacterium]